MIDRIREMDPDWVAQAEEYKELALQYTAAARERFAASTAQVRDFVVKEPVKALGIAFGVGVYLGWLIKRR